MRSKRVLIVLALAVIFIAIVAYILLTRNGGGGGGGSTIVATSQPAAGDENNPYQGIMITVGFYGNDRCEAGTEVMILEYDISQTCFGWTRSTGTGTRDNSATNFQCYRDRVCYTQMPNSFTCSGGIVNDKQFGTDTCTLDESGNLWLRILGGTESCPEAPADFSCPLTNPG